MRREPSLQFDRVRRNVEALRRLVDAFRGLVDAVVRAIVRLAVLAVVLGFPLSLISIPIPGYPSGWADAFAAVHSAD